MAQYKVPQDVEADDKLLGPFTFRQFIYLIIATGMIALAWALFQVFPLLVIIPVPIILFFGALALPLKKDQPMETYLAALVSFYLKPRKRFWEPGQSESTIRITAPKKVEASRVKDISQAEASHRLSFLAEIVDTEGHAIKGPASSPIREEVFAEANNTADMFELSNFDTHSLNQIIKNDTAERHQAAVQQMKAAIENASSLHNSDATIQKFSEPVPPPVSAPNTNSAIVQPLAPAPPPESVIVQPEPQPKSQPAPAPTPAQPHPALVNLANDKDLSIQTIAQEANRLQQKHDDEVVISLR
ncbi:PrgI family protein [Candidatus Saccharibacteria bacterium]|nr:PrgI family protein [Candidatus Saccharibacteria bacterium]